MDFKEYSELIVESVSECGYDRFMPSLCIPTESVELQVLEMQPRPAGDKEMALDWARTFSDVAERLYCAYRNGNRQVEIVEVTGAEITKKLQIDVRPYDGGDL